MATVPPVQAGDTVVFMRQDYVFRVDEYQALVVAVNEDGSLDLDVAYIAGSRINSPRTPFDPDGKPGTWHVKQP